MSKPLFTTKHYKAIEEKFAGLLNSAKEEELIGIKYTARCFAREFLIDNPKFSEPKFIGNINGMLGSSKKMISISW